MRRRLAILIVAALGVVGGGSGPAAVSAASHSTRPAVISAIPAKTCGAGYVRARIGGQIKCLRRGEYCSPRYKKDYARYGFRCVYYSGAYRLK